MKTNVGSIDRTLRIIVGLAILGAGYFYQSWWGSRQSHAPAYHDFPRLPSLPSLWNEHLRTS